MAKKKALQDIAKEIKKDIDERNILIGTERSLKEIKSGKTEKIYVSSNCPAQVKEDIERFAEISGAKVIAVKYSDEELGVICKKPFSISVLSVLKE